LSFSFDLHFFCLYLLLCHVPPLFVFHRPSNIHMATLSALSFYLQPLHA
jgi:hypothetical protein